MQDIDETLKERGSRYGNFEDHAAISQRLKAVASGEKWDKLSNFQREALEMIFHKVARLLNGDPDHEDSWHDIAGYALLVEKILSERKGSGHWRVSHDANVESLDPRP